MRIGVVSDTHLPRFGRRLPKALMNGLRESRVELILHAGDLTDLPVIDELETIAPVEAVAGNNDGPAVHERYPRPQVLLLGGSSVGLVHGDGRGLRTVDRAFHAFDEVARPDVICFGHSHFPLLERRGAVLLVNPGSPTDKRRQPRYSYALIELRTGEIRVRHHYFDDRRP